MRSDFRFTRFFAVAQKLATSCVIVAAYLGLPRGTSPFLRHSFRLPFLIPASSLRFPLSSVKSSFFPALFLCGAQFSCPCGLLFQVGFASACALASPALPRFSLAGFPPSIGFGFLPLPVLRFAFSSGRVKLRFALLPFLPGLHQNMPFIFTCYSKCTSINYCHAKI